MPTLTDILFDQPFPEPSSFVGFARNELVRDSEHRDAETLARALADPACRFFLHSGAKVLVRKDTQPGALFTLEEAHAWGGDPEQGVLLGRTPQGAPRVSIATAIREDDLGETHRLYDYRGLLYSSSVDEAEMGAIAQGGSLIAWIANHRHCGRCGAATRVEIGGYRIACTACGHVVFPRTDPVVIMLAVRGDKCLLGRSPHFPPGWYSTLAGFVEPGETIEDAVRRETFEESGIRIGRVRYHASQPWPFPHSLMIGVHCEALEETIAFQTDELEDCRWFTRDDVALMIADNHPQGFKCPPTRAIAYALIRAWSG